MAEITVKCVKEFFDKENKIKRNAGDMFVVTEERAAQIKEYESSTDKKYIEEIQKPPAEESPEQKTEDTAEQQKGNTAAKEAKKVKKAAGDVDNA